VERLHKIGRNAALTDLRRALAPGGMLVAVEPLPSHFRDLALGLTPDWFDGGASAEFPVSPLRTEDSWAQELSACGFTGVAVRTVRTSCETAALILADVSPETHESRPVERSIRIAGAAFGRDRDLLRALEAALAADGHRVDRAEGPAAGRPDTFLFMASRREGGDDVAAIRNICLELRNHADSALRDKAEFWLLCPASREGDPLADPVVAGCLSFSRTLANEVSGLSIRRVAVGKDGRRRKASEKSSAHFSRASRPRRIS
jgi:hypothetical protein